VKKSFAFQQKLEDERGRLSSMPWPMLVPLLPFTLLYGILFRTTPAGAYAFDPQDATDATGKG
jgi:hypothetical protein